MANGNGSSMMMFMVVALVAFLGYMYLKKNQSASGVTQAASQPSTTVVTPSVTAIGLVGVPYVGPVVFIDDDPDFEFPENPCHFWPGARFDPDGNRCYYPFHRDCDDRGLVWDSDRDSCISPPARVRLHDPVNVNITINETAKKGGTITNQINSPSGTWSFKLQNGKTVNPGDVTTFVSNCNSALGKNDSSCGQLRSMCTGGTTSNKDLCVALGDAGFK